MALAERIVAPINRFLERRYHHSIQSVRKFYYRLQGFNKLGLMYDDIINDENETVQLAIKRLPPRELYDRMYRIRRAMQLSLQHKVLPQEEWTKFEDERPYLRTLIAQIEMETRERNALDSLKLQKKDAKKQTH